MKIMTKDQQELCDRIETIELTLAAITKSLKEIRKSIEEQQWNTTETKTKSDLNKNY